MWESMSIDEFAAMEAAHGAKLLNLDGVWWRTVRPFFYQPLFPFEEMAPDSKSAPQGALLGGYQHLVPSREMANSFRNFFVWGNIRNYSLDTISSQRRNNIKKALKFFSLRRITDFDEFISAGYRVYLSFYERTKYPYKKERVKKEYFIEWAENVFRFPKVDILGAYYNGELAALDISYLVKDVLIDATFFSKTEHLKCQVADLMAHEMRQRASSCPGIRIIYRGALTGQKGLDGSKLQRGCIILSKPAFYRLNPIADLFLRTCMKSSYKRITGSQS